MNNNIEEELDEIKLLSNKINNLFETYTNIPNDYLTKIEFNYNFNKENTNGYIEYKRTLSSYIDNNKINKLIRQIYWRMYEGLVMENIKICYYIIGLEDSGKPSYSTQNDLDKSIEIISNTIKKMNLNLIFEYIYLFNSVLNYNFIIVKFSACDTKTNWIE